MTKEEIVENVVGNISAMWDNNAYCQYAEQFEGWCEDGEAFGDETLKDEDRAKHIELMKLVAPHVDAISEILYQYLEDED